MRRPAVLIAAGTAAFLVFLAAFLPASLLLRFIPPEVQLLGVEGTVWRGSADSVVLRGKPLGSLSWSNRPWRLAILELDYAVHLLPPGGDLKLDVSLGDARRIDLRNLRGGFPVMAIDGLLAPKGWSGTAELDVERITLVDGFPESASGTLVARDLTATGRGRLNIGSFELVLGAGTVGGEGISGRLRDLGAGPMKVRATLELRPDRSYLLSGEVAAGPEAGDAIQRTLAFLGPADSLGRRPFTVEGSL